MEWERKKIEFSAGKIYFLVIGFRLGVFRGLDIGVVEFL